MIEETTTSQTQTNPAGDVFDKYASKITANRDAHKPAEVTAEAPTTTEPVAAAETTTEVTAEVTPKEPSSNGKSHDPAKEVAPNPETVIAEPETDWRKDLGFEDNATTTTAPVAEKDDKKIISAYEEKLKEYEKLKEDPFIKRSRNKAIR